MGAFRILSLDISERAMGVCDGDIADLPRIETVALRSRDEGTTDGVARFAQWLRDRLEDGPHELLVAEGYMPLGAMHGHTNATVIEAEILLNGAARAVAACYGVPFRAPMPSTIRKHFIGKSNAAVNRGRKRTSREVAEDRAATKAAVLSRAKLLGYLPRECRDDNQADAAALWDFAAHYWGKKSSTLHMFNEQDFAPADRVK